MLDVFHRSSQPLECNKWKPFLCISSFFRAFVGANTCFYSLEHLSSISTIPQKAKTWKKPMADGRSLFQHKKKREESAVSCRRANPPGTKDQPDVLECHKNRSHPTQRGNTCSFKMAVGFPKKKRKVSTQQRVGQAAAPIFFSQSTGLQHTHCGPQQHLWLHSMPQINTNCAWKYANILANKLSPFKVMNSRNQHQIHACKNPTHFSRLCLSKLVAPASGPGIRANSGTTKPRKASIAMRPCFNSA